MLDLEQGSIATAATKEQAETTLVPELVDGLGLAREREPDDRRELLVFLGDQDLPFPTLIATMKAAEAAGLTQYVFLVEQRDGTVLVKTEPT